MAKLIWIAGLLLAGYLTLSAGLQTLEDRQAKEQTAIEQLLNGR